MPKKFIGNVKGVGIASAVREYYNSTSESSVTGGTWQTTVPTLDSSHYLWTRLKLTLTNGKVEITDPIREGMFGEEIANITGSINTIAPNKVVDVAHGGTGTTSLSGMKTLLGLAKAAFVDLVTVSLGGTGKSSHTANAVLTGNGTSAVNNVATANGALYATGTNGAAKFGTLPVGQGGTGSTTQAGARTNLGLDGKLFTQYALNSINIDNTDGNWSVDISVAGHGTMPPTPVFQWVNVTQTGTGQHFKVQIAISCNSTNSATTKSTRMWIRDKYSGGVWSAWNEVLTESTGHNSAKLWENSNPANSFGAQTINLDLSQYDYILLDYKGINSSSHVETDFIKVGGARYITYMRYVQSDHVLSCYSRSVNAKTTGIEFGTAARHDADWAKYEAADTAIVPVAIHGIKGVF